MMLHGRDPPGTAPAVLFVHWYGPPAPTSNRTQFVPDAVTLAGHGVTLAGAMGLQMNAEGFDPSAVVMQSLWHVVGLVLGIWYFLVRRE